MTQYTLASLPYAFNALEPYIDTRTMEIHYTKHHATYLANLLKCPDIDLTLPIEQLLIKYDSNPVVRNNGGGYYNHTLFWQMMSPDGGGEPAGALGEAINGAFGSFTQFKEEFTKAALTRFGSGWAWLLQDRSSGKLRIESRANQDPPDVAYSTALIGLDVWEHAYYLHYQNRRADYISNWWYVVNWSYAERHFKK